MRKGFKFYVLIWVILLAVFNVVCFVTPRELAGMNKFGGAFWAGYTFITIAFVGQLVCAAFAFKAENLKKLFYNIPLITLSYVGLVVMLIVGTLSMAIPDLPNWLGIVICFVALTITAIAIIKAVAAADIVARVDEKVAVKTSFIRDLTLQSESLHTRAKTAEAKAICKKICETVRYSDPMTDLALAEIEADISGKMQEFTTAVMSENTEDANNCAETLIVLLGDRNKLCMARK